MHSSITCYQENRNATFETHTILNVYLALHLRLDLNALQMSHKLAMYTPPILLALPLDGPD